MQASNFETDYYARGTAVSFILDMEIRQRTKNRGSLDNVMRLMYKRFPLGKGGYTDADFQKACEEIAGSSMQEFFDDYVDGTKPLPWEDALKVAGLKLEDKDKEKKPWLGISTNDEGGRTRITRVLAGSPGYEAGLDVNDEVVAINGYKARSHDMGSRIGDMKEGDTVRVSVFRDEKLREFAVTLRLPEFVAQKVIKIEKPSALQSIVYASWLDVPSKKR